MQANSVTINEVSKQEAERLNAILANKTWNIVWRQAGSVDISTTARIEKVIHGNSCLFFYTLDEPDDPFIIQGIGSTFEPAKIA